MNRYGPRRHGARRFAVLLAIAAASTGCGGEPTPAPRVPGAALEVDGVSIPRAAIEDYMPYFDSFDPRLGRKAKVRELLTQQLLPVAFAQRDFPAERAEQRARAAALHAVAQNYLELRARGDAFGGHEPELPFARGELPFAVARYAFAEDNLGRTSEPIETPQGFALIAPHEIVPGRTIAGDLCRAYVVLFHHQTVDEYRDWWQRTKDAARQRVTYVDPDLRDALPVWLEP